MPFAPPAAWRAPPGEPCRHSWRHRIRPPPTEPGTPVTVSPTLQAAKLPESAAPWERRAPARRLPHPNQHAIRRHQPPTEPGTPVTGLQARKCIPAAVPAILQSHPNPPVAFLNGSGIYASKTMRNKPNFVQPRWNQKHGSRSPAPLPAFFRRRSPLRRARPSQFRHHSGQTIRAALIRVHPRLNFFPHFTALQTPVN